jgi:hypothetical protein
LASRVNSLESEGLDVVEEAPSSGLSFAGRLPEDASGVDHVTEENGGGDVTKQPEDDELDAQRERLLLFVDGSVDDKSIYGVLWNLFLLRYCGL